MESTPMEQSAISSSSPPPTLEELTRRTARSLLLPYVIDYVDGMASSRDPREAVAILNPFTRSLTLIENPDNIESVIQGKEGPLPATKASIDALPLVKVVEDELECAICLLVFEIGEEAKEMPCKHRYHADCIDKWLGKRASCPICRYKMPEDLDGNSDEQDQEGSSGRSSIQEFVFRVYSGRRYVRRRRRSRVSDPDPTSEFGDNNSGPREEPNQASVQGMEIDNE